MNPSPRNLAHTGVADVAQRQARVVTLSQLRTFGVTEAQRRAHVEAGRWRAVGHRAVVVDTGPLVGESLWWLALATTACKARLGGVTALQAAGLEGFSERYIHVWVERHVRHGRPRGVRIHVTRRWDGDDLAPSGIPRSRPDVAAVQAALWARSPRQAVLLLIMAVQQRLATAEDVAAQLERVRRHPYRTLLRHAMADVVGGVQSLGEYDFAVECRRVGLPEPSRQVLRKTSQGRVYLDVRWARYSVRVEIDGAQHLAANIRLDDELRDIDGDLQGDRVLRLTITNMRASTQACMRRVEAALRQGGWHG